MTTPTHSDALAHEDDPTAAVWNMIYGLFGFVALKAWVDLECSEHLRAEPLTAAALAERCGAQEQFLARLLRTMASLGFARPTAPGVYGLTEAGRVLSADVPGSMRAGVLVAGEQAAWDAMRQVSQTVRT